MNSPDPLDHWKSLADEMNVDPSKAKSRPVEPSDDMKSPEEPLPRAQKAKRVSKSWAPGDWSELAHELGVEVSAEQAKPKAAQAEEPSVESGIKPSATAASAQNDRQPDSPPAATTGVGANDDSPTDDLVEPAEVDNRVSFFEPDSAQEIDTAEIVLEEEPAGSPEIPQEELELPANATTGEGDDEGSRRSGTSKRGRRRSADDRATDESESQEAQPPSGDAADATAEQSVNEKDGKVDTDISSEEPPKRPRRRRRRRPARRDGETGESGDVAEESAADASSDVDDADDKSTADRRQGTRTKHRKIPTWEETISMIVDSNLQARSKTGPPKGGPRGSRRRGRGSGKRS